MSTISNPVVSDMLPDKQKALRAIKELKARILSTDTLNRPLADYSQLSDDSTSRLRWRPPILPLFSKLTPERAIALSGWWVTLKPCRQDELLKTFNDLSLLSKQYEQREERVFFGELGDIYKKYQDLISTNWMFYVDVHLLTDYLPVKIEALTQDVKDWVTGDIEHSLGGSTTLFDKYFREGVRTFFNNCVGPEPDQISSDDFLKDPMYYARVGVSDGPRITMVADGKLVKAKRSKWASFLSMTRSELRRLLFGRTKWQHGKAFAKREKGKIRAVITVDDETYIQMSFVSQWIEAKLRSHPNTPLFYNSRQMMDLFYSLAQDKGGVRNPIDQKEFDHRVTLKMVNTALLEMKEYIKKDCSWTNKNELIAVMCILIRRLSNGTITLPDGGEVVITKGVLSGWRWTSLIDSIVNAAEVYAFAKLMKDHGIAQPINNFVSFGDDVATGFNDFGRAIVFNTTYQRTNFIVNPKKTFLSPVAPGKPTVDEFLRLVCTQDQVLGYSARAVASLIYRNPTNPNPPPGTSRIREMADNWNLVFSRNKEDASSNLTSMMISDISKANRISFKDTYDILHTPSTFGGCGLTPYTNDMKQVESPKPIVHWKYHTLPPLAHDQRHSPEQVADVWIGNLTPNKKVRKTFLPFTIKKVLDRVNVYQSVPINMSAHTIMSISFNHTIGPTDIELYKHDINAARNKKQVLAICDACVDPLDIGKVHGYSRLMTTRVLKALVTSKLPKNVPIVPGWGALPVSVVYSTLYDSILASRFKGRKIGWNTLLKVAMTAEHYTPQLLSSLPTYTG